jgi:hypothetical protein
VGRREEELRLVRRLKTLLSTRERDGGHDNSFLVRSQISDTTAVHPRLEALSFMTGQF